MSSRGGTGGRSSSWKNARHAAGAWRTRLTRFWPSPVSRSWWTSTSWRRRTRSGSSTASGALSGPSSAPASRTFSASGPSLLVRSPGSWIRLLVVLAVVLFGFPAVVFLVPLAVLLSGPLLLWFYNFPVAPWGHVQAMFGFRGQAGGCLGVFVGVFFITPTLMAGCGVWDLWLVGRGVCCPSCNDLSLGAWVGVLAGCIHPTQRILS